MALVGDFLMRAVCIGFILNLMASTAFADDILLIRGLDQFIFRGMDVLGDELAKSGHKVTVRSPIGAQMDGYDYDVVIGNSQGAVVAMNRKQKIKPRLIVTIDIPYHTGWRSYTKHLNIYGPGWGNVKGATNKYIHKGHLTLSYAADMRKLVHQFVNVW